ncbi:MAG: hypothetical protein MJ002_00510 [Paludibacteraceae bacterium]|nr:hypothetical protein [Paludibacteraceae bacterium]
MKKVVLALVAIMICAVSFDASAQNNKALEKALKKEYKKKLKEYQKEGWMIYGSSRTLEVALLKHYESLNNEDVREIFATTTSTSQNIGSDKLEMNASTKYAKQAGMRVKGRIVEDMGSVISTEEAEEFEHFYEAYEAAVDKEIRGEIKLSYALYRPTTIAGKKGYEFRAYYIVDEESATKARIRAFQNAARESEVAQKYAEKVSDFIKDGFPVSE